MLQRCNSSRPRPAKPPFRAARSCKPLKEAPSLPSASLCRVTLYPHSNYGGSSQVIGPGSTDMGGLSVGNDQVSQPALRPRNDSVRPEAGSWEPACRATSSGSDSGVQGCHGNYLH